MSSAWIALAALCSVSEPTRVAIPAWSSAPEDRALAAQLADGAALELSRRPGWVVISAAELDLLVAHQRDLHDVLACAGEAECLAKLSRAVDAERLLGGRLDRLGPSWLLTLSWADTGTRAASRGESLLAESPAELVAGLPSALARLVGDSALAARTGTVATPGSHVLVLPLVNAAAGAGLGESVGALVALELRRAGLEVVARDEVQALLTYAADRQIAEGIEDPAALAEVGAALGVDYLVAGTVGRLGPRAVLHLKLLSVQHARVTARVSEGFEGPEPLFAGAARVAVRALVGAPLGRPGALEVLAEASGEVDVDGAVARLPARFEALHAGRHRARVRAEGFVPVEQDVYVEPGQAVRWRPALEPVEVPLLERWWLWTAVGVALAGVGVAIAIGSQAPELGGVRGQVVIPPP